MQNYLNFCTHTFEEDNAMKNSCSGDIFDVYFEKI